MIPSTITQGDSLSWTESDNNYPASDGWIFGYKLVNSSAQYSFESIADVDSHVFSLLSATTAAYKPGEYSYQRYVVNGLERTTLNQGSINIVNDFTKAFDARSHAAKTLNAIEAVLENRATLDQESYAINGRSLTRMSITDLLAFRDTYRAEVAAEKNAERIAQGLGTKQLIRVRF